MQGQEDARLCHILKEAILHVGKELPQGLQQRKVTEVAGGASMESFTEKWATPGRQFKETAGQAFLLPPHPKISTPTSQ